MENTKIFDLGCNGEGIGKINGKVVFIPFCLPGEEVEFNFIKQNKSFCNGKLNSIKNKSVLRTIPLCPYFGCCGGCDLQHIKYIEQLKFKQNQLQNTFKKVYGKDVDICEVIASNEWNYRNKMVFPIQKKQGRFCLGMYQKNSHSFVEIEKCCIADKKINEAIICLKEFLHSEELNFLQLEDDFLRYVMIRLVGEELSLTFIVNQKNNRFENILKNFKFDFISQIYVNYNSESKNILSDQFCLIKGKAFLKALENGIEYQISPYSFIQVNTFIKDKLYKDVCDIICLQDIIINAYSGAGLLTAIFSKKAKFVYGIELNESAHESAEELLKKNNIKNVENIHGDCLICLPKVLKNLKEEFTLVLDPPRNGVNRSLLELINLQTQCNKIIYISCNPNTLCRDLKEFTNFKIVKIQPYDMFPQTVNVETLVVLERNKK